MAESAGQPELLLHPHLQPDELLAQLQGRLQAVLATRDRMRGLLRLLIDDPARTALMGQGFAAARVMASSAK